MSGIIRLQNYSTFTLFVGYKPVVAAKALVEGGPGDEHTLLDDNRCAGRGSMAGELVACVPAVGPKSDASGWCDCLPSCAATHACWRTAAACGAPLPVASTTLALARACRRYIADVVAELRSPKATHDGWQARLLFKKRMFRETDEAVSEPQFVNLSYIQARGAAAAAVLRAHRPR